MKKVFLMLVVTIFAISFTACVTTKAVRLGEGEVRTESKIHWTQVKVFRTADQVKGDYEEIGLLITKGDSLWTSEKGMWNSMKKKAATLGANAIILDAISEPAAGAKVVGAIFGVGVNRKGKAIAIYIHPKKK